MRERFLWFLLDGFLDIETDSFPFILIHTPILPSHKPILLDGILVGGEPIGSELECCRINFLIHHPALDRPFSPTIRKCPVDIERCSLVLFFLGKRIFFFLERSVFGETLRRARARLSLW